MQSPLCARPSLPPRALTRGKGHVCRPKGLQPRSVRAARCPAQRAVPQRAPPRAMCGVRLCAPPVPHPQAPGRVGTSWGAGRPSTLPALQTRHQGASHAPRAPLPQRARPAAAPRGLGLRGRQSAALPHALPAVQECCCCRRCCLHLYPPAVARARLPPPPPLRLLNQCPCPLRRRHPLPPCLRCLAHHPGPAAATAAAALRPGLRVRRAPAVLPHRAPLRQRSIRGLLARKCERTQRKLQISASNLTHTMWPPRCHQQLRQHVSSGGRLGTRSQRCLHRALQREGAGG